LDWFLGCPDIWDEGAFLARELVQSRYEQVSLHGVIRIGDRRHRATLTKAASTKGEEPRQVIALC
jgi:hypothetical protein